MARALDLPATAEALAAYRRGGGGLLAGGAVLAALAVGVGTFTDGAELVTWIVAGAAASVLLGLGRFAYARRFRRILSAGPWSAHPATAFSRAMSGEAVVLTAPDGAGRWVLRPIASRARWAAVRPVPVGVLWWCGDPAAGGVLAAPGGGELFRAKPVRGAAARRRAVARAEQAGLAGLPFPAQPQAAADAEARPRAAAVADAESPAAAVAAPSALTYARLAAHAEGWAAAGRNARTRRPEADVRAVPWWRVRTLRRIAGLTQVGGAAAVTAVMGGLLALDVIWPEPGSGGPDVLTSSVLLLLGAGWLVWACFAAWTRGVPVVRVLVRAATAPVPVERRYALVPEPVGEGALLVVFPAHGGPDDRPEGVLPLLPPDRPVEPTGTVELRGWLDRDGEPGGDGDAVVVAWCGERPLWPAGPYGEAGSRTAAELLDGPALVMEPERQS
ncbi:MULTISPECIES: hypothetical protein [Streptomyces]|uniref:Integral membrane protein n=2 Tax=Streptomyces TaxID=1883 RepID=A0ABU4K5M7_9ACTN|nr:hypothetical protein [Streptomyces roseolus]MDX2293058.1 hypothetical protein [Streptomyces roseolus]